MNNTIEYFYQIKPQNIIKIGTTYRFKYESETYYFEIFTAKADITKSISLFDTISQLNPLISEIIPNKDKEYITKIENIPYYLYKVNINEQINLKLADISYLSTFPVDNSKLKIASPWHQLWSDRIDYLERQINEMGKKYPLLVESFNYYTGLTEVAISYIQNTVIEQTPTALDTPVLSHRHISNQLNIKELYNPTNFILDHKSRDLSEYLKKSFINGNKEIYQELTTYFKHHYFSQYGIRLLMGRLLYPSYYFEIYDEILRDGEPEKKITTITNQVDEYEAFLKNIYHYLLQNYHIPEIEWLN